MKKTLLRAAYLAKRQALSPTSHRILSQKVANLFFDVLPPAARVVHTYLPLVKTKEPDTYIIIDRLRSGFAHVRICAGRMNGDVMESFFLEKDSVIQTSPRWSVPEPVGGVPVPAGIIDVAIVPLLVADRALNRVGYGKGHYDRFLVTCAPSCLKVGLSLFAPVDMIEDAEPHDQVLDILVTPDGILRRGA